MADFKVDICMIRRQKHSLFTTAFDFIVLFLHKSLFMDSCTIKKECQITSLCSLRQSSPDIP